MASAPPDPVIELLDEQAPPTTINAAVTTLRRKLSFMIFSILDGPHGRRYRQARLEVHRLTHSHLEFPETVILITHRVGFRCRTAPPDTMGRLRPYGYPRFLALDPRDTDQGVRVILKLDHGLPQPVEPDLVLRQRLVGG